jgi:hypothetical protein
MNEKRVRLTESTYYRLGMTFFKCLFLVENAYRRPPDELEEECVALVNIL